MAELKIIRIELVETSPGHSATGEDYKRLHQFMDKKNWKTHIYPNALGSTDKHRYPLPTATYCGDSNELTSNIAILLTKEIEQNIWPTPRVLVMGVHTNWAIRGH